MGDTVLVATQVVLLASPLLALAGLFGAEFAFLGNKRPAGWVYLFFAGSSLSVYTFFFLLPSWD